MADRAGIDHNRLGLGDVWLIRGSLRLVKLRVIASMEGCLGGLRVIFKRSLFRELILIQGHFHVLVFLATVGRVVLLLEFARRRDRAIFALESATTGPLGVNLFSSVWFGRLLKRFVFVLGVWRGDLVYFHCEAHRTQLLGLALAQLVP